MRSVEITLSDAEEALLAPIKEKNGWTWKEMLLQAAKGAEDANQ